MYAVIKTGGKQYKVAPGDRLRVETIEAEEGDSVFFDEVLLVNDEGDVTVGQPNVADASVKATCLGDGRAKKVIVYKFKRRKDYHRKQGHRQDYTAVMIDEVLTDSAAIASAKESAVKAPAAEEKGEK
jgi:large subunit ribosomal protein L21